MTVLVIDASVAIKWVIDEPGTAQALALLRFRLIAPDLLVAECATILWKKARRQELTRDQAIYAARLIEQASIDLWPTRPLLAPALELAMALDHPACDCLYLALAEAEACHFVTADDHFVRKLRQNSRLFPLIESRMLSLMTAMGTLNPQGRA